jgi:hypothetical protein
MTSKQIRVNSDLINSQLYKMSVGFDRLFEDFFQNPVNISAQSYPPYNVLKYVVSQVYLLKKQDLKQNISTRALPSVTLLVHSD